MQKVMMTGKPSLPKDEKVTSKDSLIQKGREEKGNGSFWKSVKLGLETFGMRERELLNPEVKRNH